MKSGDTKKPFPVTDADWEKLLADAPGTDICSDAAEEHAWEEKAVVVREGGYPAVRAALAARRRGKQKAQTKAQIAIRLDRDILDAFRASGPGWQTRMNEALREWLRTHGER